MPRNIIVLLTSISKKVPLIQAVKKALVHFGPKSRIIGTDNNPHCIGRYFVDDFLDMPLIANLTREDVVELCKAKKINAIIPTRDGELSFWGEHHDYFAKHGIHVMVSEVDAIENCLDKYHFYRFLKAHHYPVPPTFLEINNFEFNEYVVKERVSIAPKKPIGINLNFEEAVTYANSLLSPLFQPFIAGEEFSVDVYVKQNHKVFGSIARKRDLVMDGESQISTTCRDYQLEKMCCEIAEAFPLKGHVLFQVIKQYNTHHYYIIECNPRFGGASTLSIAAGLDTFRWFFHEILKEKLPPFVRTPKELRLVRHAEDTIVSF